MFRALASLAMALAIIGFLGSPVFAQGNESDGDDPREELLQKQEALFERMLDEPANLDIAFEYAAVSARLGDYEAAITALERMLLFAPGLARVQLELGVMYYRLESYNTARHHLKQAVSGEDVPPQVRDRVETYLREIDDRQSPHQWSGKLFTGIRFQTNANAAPESRDIIIGGAPFLLRDQDTGQEDFNVFLSGSLRYAYDLGRQGDKIVAELSAYGARYQDQDSVDTEIAQIKLGPLFDFEKYGYEGGSVSPYLLANGARLGGDPYFVSYGGGVTAILPVNTRNLVSVRAEYHRRDYHNSASRPTASNRDGWRALLDGALRHNFTERTAVAIKLGAARASARENFESRWEYGGGLSLTTYANIWSRAWRFRASVAYRIVTHDEPDIAISTQAQRDDEILARLGLSVPLSRDTSIVLQGGYSRVNSNYDIAEHDNGFGLLGIAVKF